MKQDFETEITYINVLPSTYIYIKATRVSEKFHNILIDARLCISRDQSQSKQW